MSKYEVGFDGSWQGSFDDLDLAIQWAQEVAECGWVVDVVFKRPFLPRRFVTAFPESEIAARKAAWAVPVWTGGGIYGG